MEEAISARELQKKLEAFAAAHPHREVQEAIDECAGRASTRFANAGGGWTGSAVDFFLEEVAPRIEHAIATLGVSWSGQPRLNALERLDRMCDRALQASTGNIVTRKEAELAFTQLKCPPQSGTTASIKTFIAFCE